LGKHYRHRAGLAMHCRQGRCIAGENDIWLERKKLGCMGAQAVGIAGPETHVELNVLDPTPLAQSAPDRREARRRQRAALSHGNQPPDARPPLRLLGVRHKWPRGHTAEPCDELAAAGHSMTASARASRVDGMSRPSAFAAFKLITSSTLVPCWTGRSLGF